MNSATRPVEIDVDRTTEVRIVWGDGHRSVYPLGLLRQACPCAECRSNRSEAKGNGLPIVPSPAVQRQMSCVEAVELVGQYGLQVRWQDGHDAGIYGFELLRSLCPSGAGTATNKPARTEVAPYSYGNGQR